MEVEEIKGNVGSALITGDRLGSSMCRSQPMNFFLLKENIALFFMSFDEGQTDIVFAKWTLKGFLCLHGVNSDNY